MKAKGDEKTLTIEMIISLGCDVTTAIMQGRAPKPSSLVATLLSFGILSAVGNTFPSTMPLCAGIGGLVVLTEFVSSNGPGRAIISLIGGKFATPAGTTADVQQYQLTVANDVNNANAQASLLVGASPAPAQVGSPSYTLPGTGPSSSPSAILSPALSTIPSLFQQ